MPTGVSANGCSTKIEPIGCESSTECYGEDCDFWVGYGYTCAQLEDYYDCDCGHCLCGETEEDEATCGTCSDINWEDSISRNCAADITLDLVRVSPADLRLCPLWVTIDTSHFLDADTESSVTMTLTGKRGKHSAMTSTRVVASGLSRGQRHVAFVEVECGLTDITSVDIEVDTDDAWGPSAIFLRYDANPAADGDIGAAWGAGATSWDVLGLTASETGEGNVWMSEDPAEGWRRKSFDVLKSSIAQAEEGTSAAKVAAISVGLLIAILMLLVIAFVTVAAVLRKIGKEDKIPEAIRATSAYSTMFPGLDDDEPMVAPTAVSSSQIEMSGKNDLHGTSEL